MHAGFELIMRSMSTLKEVRTCKNQAFKDVLKESVNVPMGIVKDIFARLRRTHGTVSVHDACSQEQMSELREISDTLQSRTIAEGQPELTMESEEVKLFVKRHCKSSHYV